MLMHTTVSSSIMRLHPLVSTEGSIIIRNMNPTLTSELPSARGRRFTQPFTNNYALQSIWYYMVRVQWLLPPRNNPVFFRFSAPDL